jgi:thiamine-phosphate pyrophosphorylase
MHVQTLKPEGTLLPRACLRRMGQKLETRNLHLMYITDRRQLPGDPGERRRRLLNTIAAAAHAGIDLIQLREKDLTANALEELALEVVALIQGTPAKVLVNSRLDVAIAAGAQGVHLRSDDGELTASEARVVLHKAGYVSALITASCHSLEEVALAEAHGADFAVLGPVFQKNGAQVASGLALLTAASSRAVSPGSRMAVLALGGVTLENARLCVEAGADGIAAIRLFQQDPKAIVETVSALRRLWRKGAASGPKNPHPYQAS